MAKVFLIGLGRDAAFFEKTFGSVEMTCESLPDLDKAIEKIHADPPALIVAGKPEQIESLYSLRETLKTAAPATPCLVALPHARASDALEALRAGAYECVARPFDKFTVLAAAKRAGIRHGRTLFVRKVAPPKNPLVPIAAALLIGLGGTLLSKKILNGPPPDTMSLGSAHLAGIQWDGRYLWVADWFESTLTRYEAKKGFFKSSRDLVTSAIFRSQDAQPILVADTPDAMVTVGSDLRMRLHQRTVGLPAVQVVGAPGVSPSGLAWDGREIWSCDVASNMLYRHGKDLSVLESIKSIVPSPAGLAAERGGLWVVGGKPLRLARLERSGDGWLWRGPYDVSNILGAGVEPTGVAVGFGRLWLVAGGDPKIASRSLSEITRQLEGWKRAEPADTKKKEDKEEKDAARKA